MTTNSNIPMEKESMDENYVIETFNLTKRYKMRGKAEKLTALNNVNLKVKRCLVEMS